MRRTEYATDSLPLGGYGYPVKPNGLICSMFRPSDDATVYPYLIPSNLFALESLRQMKLLFKAIGYSNTNAPDVLIKDITEGLKGNATVINAEFGEVYAYEVNGYGSMNLMDDANVPSLLSMAYLIPDMVTNPIYRNTRNFVLSQRNPFFFKGKAAEGIGGPHVGMDYIWPLSITMRGLTSKDEQEIKACLKTLQNTHADTGFMHEAFHKDDATKFTRPWFAWANTLFGEFVWKVYKEKPQLLS
jgi:meiotically up-regulated gene 157 (Mug157) protein